MMQSEFEKMIGKKVSYETFEMYEKMYSALPENVTKQQFVEMLNVKSIPESEDAIARRAERDKFVEGIKKEIRDLDEKIEYEQYLLDNDSFGACKSYLKLLKAQRKELKFVIA